MTTLTRPAPAVKPTRNASRPAASDGLAAADDRWHAEQSTDPHFTGPTPVEALDAPEPDWDALAEESAALDRLCAGCLL